MTATLDAIGVRSTGQDGIAYPELDNHGMPLDRTVCPRCLQLSGQYANCRQCGGQPVCPTCRGGRVMSVAGQQLRYIVCPDCCIPAEGFTVTGIPNWYASPNGQAQAIRRYQQARRRERTAAILREDDADVPF